jgi:hypothetical protein
MWALAGWPESVGKGGQEGDEVNDVFLRTIEEKTEDLMKHSVTIMSTNEQFARCSLKCNVSKIRPRVLSRERVAIPVS